jgi:hypothetical protein
VSSLPSSVHSEYKPKQIVTASAGKISNGYASDHILAQEKDGKISSKHFLLIIIMTV